MHVVGQDASCGMIFKAPFFIGLWPRPKPTDVAAARRAARCRVPLVKECRSCGLAHVQ